MDSQLAFILLFADACGGDVGAPSDWVLSRIRLVGQPLLTLLEHREDSACWLQAESSPFDASGFHGEEA